MTNSTFIRSIVRLACMMHRHPFFVSTLVERSHRRALGDRHAVQPHRQVSDVVAQVEVFLS